MLLATFCILGTACAPDSNLDGAYAQVYLPHDFRQLSTLRADEFAQAAASTQRLDHIQDLYRADETREATISFFEALTGSRLVSQLILGEAARLDIAPALAFALAWQESRFQPRAVGPTNVNQTVDRGLFQLNSRTFAHIKAEDFFDPAINARLGLTHLAFCLRQGGNEVVALAIYNAGLNRIRGTGTPLTTLNYINRIIGYRDKLEALFEAQVVANYSQETLLVHASSFETEM
ncbi:MAG: hypothetical protein A2087_02025 [Spirochaetes bacterium GWD1_61_31]|nr:MAG: hypothetical protein A2Y37_11755 [Spirochaetes bacterium GWB1_60_80]OHD29942.1 MAG: hypothetical protein A2004_11995 [Spirochaetes bacterium GWC1_61_12]OHD43799.1 MAG: hypothetical protein A2087_02025 [Spirochaetes bacterium GWD1_61_31]OHD46041.1 MAG: hypothetical protein A2Y35_13580 [Spirochaetes bacterium GWE1_60_18]OHD60613.1 MAG: hypothetical protein A2Y32_08070 [Spirochaetes bacterium GWF1_60_12]